jgi:hypothetical protein
MWATAAARAVRSRAWRPTPAERAIAGDVARAVWRPTASPPPHEDESLASRLGRLASWAAAIRLAMRAGGWMLQTSVPEPGLTGVVRAVLPAPPPAEDARMSLAGFLTALYRPLREAEDWHRVHNELALPPLDMSPGQAAARMTELVPGLPDVVYAIEGLLTDVAEILTAVAARS